MLFAVKRTNFLISSFVSSFIHSFIHSFIRSFIRSFIVHLSVYPGLTPVHVATREGSVDVLKYLFQMGANKNVAVSHKCSV